MDSDEDLGLIGEAVVDAVVRRLLGSIEVTTIDIPERSLDLREAASYLQVSERVLGDLCRAGKVPSRKVGDQWRLSRRALDKYLEGAV